MGWISGVLPGAENLFTTTSRPALGPTQPPIQWVPGALSLGVKQPGCVLRSKNEWSYASTPQYAYMALCSVKKNMG